MLGQVVPYAFLSWFRHCVGDVPAAASGLANGGGVELAGIGALGAWRRRVSRATPTAEDALRHLLLTVDVDRLFRFSPHLLYLSLLENKSTHTVLHFEHLCSIEAVAHLQRNIENSLVTAWSAGN